jgi:hypothetical protein
MKKLRQCRVVDLCLDGASRIRTGGLRVANATLYQLSYGPSAKW